MPREAHLQDKELPPSSLYLRELTDSPHRQQSTNCRRKGALDPLHTTDNWFDVGRGEEPGPGTVPEKRVL